MSVLVLDVELLRLTLRPEPDPKILNFFCAVRREPEGKSPTRRLALERKSQRPAQLFFEVYSVRKYHGRIYRRRISTHDFVHGTRITSRSQFLTS